MRSLISYNETIIQLDLGSSNNGSGLSNRLGAEFWTQTSKAFEDAPPLIQVLNLQGVGLSSPELMKLV